MHLISLPKEIFNLDFITNKNNKDDDEKWSYRMLIIGRSGSEKTNALLTMLKIYVNHFINFLLKYGKMQE